MSSNRIKGQMKLASMHRRQFGRVAVGVFAVVGLAACGGGGGGGEDGSEYPLRAAYEKINKGMTKEEVLAIVGREPESKSDGNWIYRSDAEDLNIGFSFQNGSSVRTVNRVRWETVGHSPVLVLEK